MRTSVALLLVVFPLVASAVPTGISGYSGMPGTSTCGACHGGTAAAPTLTLTGPATLSAGQTGAYTLTVSGGPGVAAGMDAALSGVNSGAAAFIAGAGTRLDGTELVHSAARAFSGGKATFGFSIKAPLTAGPFTVSVAALSTNSNGSQSGDGTGKTTMGVTVQLPAPGFDAGTAVVDAGSPVPGVDAGMPPKPAVDAGVKASAVDAGSAMPSAQPSTPTSRSPTRSDGLVEGEGCNSTGAGSALGALIWGFAVFKRRSTLHPDRAR